MADQKVNIKVSTTGASKSKQELYQVDFENKDNLELKWAGQSYDGQNYTTE